MQHLDEGTIHAWLDGQLPREEAQQVEAHVAECRQCADAVAEARGLIAASSRILMALDNVPRDVVPASAPPDVEPPALMPAAHEAKLIGGAAGRSRRRWFNGVTLAAAATIVVAVGITLTLPSYKQSMQLADRSSPTVARTPSTDTAVVTAPLPVVATPPASPPPRAAALGAAGQPAEQRFAATTPANVLRREANQPAPRPAAAAVDERADVARVVDSAGTRAVEIRRAKAAEPVDVATRDSRKDAKAERPQSVAAAPPAPAIPVETALVKVFRGAPVARPDSPATVFAQRAPGVATASAGSVRGRVTDANNTGLPGAMVHVIGTTIGVVTNAAGEYTVGGLTSGSHRLLVRRIGYDSASRDVTVTAGQTSVADLVLRPMETALSEVVTTGAPASATVPARKTAPARDRAAAIETAPGAPITATQSNAIGCYELGITSTTPSRNGFREVPRRVALDAEIVPANADGVWYRARDLARTASVPNGLWRPNGPDAVEIEWTYGSRTARIRVAGPAGSMMRGTLEEIDRATATGEAGNVVAVRRPCAP
jgi:hypothetical protein